MSFHRKSNNVLTHWLHSRCFSLLFTVLVVSDTDNSRPNIFLQGDAGRASDGSHPACPSAFVIGCSAPLACLFFTSLQQSTVNQTLFYSSWVLSSRSVCSPLTRYLWGHPSSVRWLPCSLCLTLCHSFSCRGRMSLPVCICTFYYSHYEQIYAFVTMKYFLKFSFFSIQISATRWRSCDVQHRSEASALKSHHLYLLHKQRRPEAVVDIKQ